MGFRNGAYATVWQVEPGKGKFYKVRISTSKKNRQTDQYEQDFSGFCTFIGTAMEGAKNLKERDRIQLKEVEVTNTYNKDTKQSYTNFNVFAFEPAGEYTGTSGAPASTHGSATEGNATEGDDSDLPF